MRVEARVDGAQIMRGGTGHQKLLVASAHQAEIILVSTYGEVVSCKRHHDDALKRTVPCCCIGPCYSQRTDRFLGALYRVGPTLWDERVLILPAGGWNSLQQTCVQRSLDHEDLRGLRCNLRRTGDPVNGRTSCVVQDRVKNCPAGFDLLAGIRNCTGIAADFFGDADGGEIFLPAVTPMKLRSDKPHVPLGTKRP